MCNNGIYFDKNNKQITGTPIKVSEIISSEMNKEKYANKTVTLYFNDIDKNKIDELNKHLPLQTNNFKIHTSHKDANVLLKEIKNKVIHRPSVHYLLFYDPYEASIDWTALKPYFYGWGEVIINHVVSDTLRAIKQAKTAEAISKYQDTYLNLIQYLVSTCTDRTSYEKIIYEIIKTIRKPSNKKYYIASFPFFNSKNSLVYDIIFFTNNIDGFKLFKTQAWNIFGGKSSNKNTHGKENILSLDFETNLETIKSSDEYCYNVTDIAEYIIKNFSGQKDVSLKEIWDLVNEHPVFPTDGYKIKIKNQIKKYGHNLGKSKVDFI